MTKKTKKTKKKRKGGRKRSRTASKHILIKLQTKNMKVLDACKTSATNKYQEKKCLDKFNDTWTAYSLFLKRHGKKVYTPKQQREIMKKFFGQRQ